MAYEVTITHLSGSRRSEVQTFTTLPLVLGRAEDADVQFDPDADLKVSARHAELRKGAEGLELHDLGSTNGVLVDGQRVDGHLALPASSAVEVGQGGPRLRVQWTDSGGVNFSELRMKTDKIAQPGSKRPLAATDQALPTYASLDDAPAGFNAGPVVVVGAVVAVLGALGALVLLFV